jgi:carboxylate-amine ligase
MSDRPPLSLGIEEEYLIVDRETRELVTQPPDAFIEACADRLGDQVTVEFLQCQVEVGTTPHRAVADAVADLRSLRDGVAAAAAEFGFAPIAASTHPFSRWRDQSRTRKERYDGLQSDLGRVIERMLICGMHIHVGVEDDDLRMDLMGQATYFLPHLLALSCSSPFWEGEDTGLASYRLTVFDSMPRTGLPDEFVSFAAYRRMIDRMVQAGCIEDATKIWWDIRPSDKFPTIEQRATDICSRLEDAACIAAIFQSILAFLYRLKCRNQRWRLYPRTLIMENRWRAQRFGAEGKLIDLGRGTLADFPDLVEELVDILAPDAEALDCRKELLHARRIAAEGNSATRQRRVRRSAVDAGADPHESLVAVVDHLIAEF